MSNSRPQAVIIGRCVPFTWSYSSPNNVSIMSKPFLDQVYETDLLLQLLMVSLVPISTLHVSIS